MVKYRFLIVDLDGVVWKGGQPIEENVRVLKKLYENGVDIVFLTNNSTRSRLEYSIRLRELGFNVDIDKIITSGFLAAEYIRLNMSGDKVFVVGEAGLYYELSRAGLLPVTIGTPADHVVVGLDRFLTYNKIAYASRLILDGASFIATNTDKTYPVEQGVEPGAGSITALISEAVGKGPDVVTGKPSKWVIEYIIETYNVDREHVLLIGDRVDTDIQMGVENNIDTLLVLTGVSRVEDLDKYGFKPKYVTRNLAEFLSKNHDLFP